MGILRSLFRGERRLPSDAVRPAPDRLLTSGSKAVPGGKSVLDVTESSAEVTFAESLRSIIDAEARAPEDASLKWAHATALARWGRHREAVVAYNAAARAGTAELASHYIQRGWSEIYAGNRTAALQSFERALLDEPTAEAHYALGFVLHLLKQLPPALQHLDRCLELDPQHARAYVVAATCELIRNDPEAAARYLHRAVERQPNHASAWSNLGVALDRLDRDAEALAAYEEAARLERATGEDVGGLTNFAIAVGQTGRVNEALRLMASDERPPGPYRQYVRGLALIRVGRLEEGWPYHEFRLACEPSVSERPGLTIPRWCGQDLVGQRIVIRAEQGFGDTLQFLRYAPWLKHLGATVCLRVQEGFDPAGLAFDGVDQVLTGDEGVETDFYIPSMSLPAVFGTGCSSIPEPVPYVHVAPAVVHRWSTRLPPSNKLRVGIVWAGNPEHQRDRYRSLPLVELAPLWAVPGVEFFSLQKKVPEADVSPPAFAQCVTDLASHLETFADTAAAILHFDLVICVDTSVAHLAGALGCPTWVLLPTPADWRWMLDRSDSPWYPSMRLFRQKERRQWAPVIEDVARALAGLVSGSPKPALLDACRTGRTMTTGSVPPTIAAPLDERAVDTVRLAEARYGLTEYLPDEPIVGRSIAYCGEYLQLLLVDVLRLLPPGSTVVEVGAGIGAHTLGLSTQVGEPGHVIVFEHRLRHRTALQHNASYNRMRNVTLMLRPARGAVGISEGAFSDSVDDLQLDTLTCLKIGDGVRVDEVLSGAEATLWRLRPVVLVSSPSETRSLSERLRGFGYRSWRIETPLFNPDNFDRWADDVFSGATATALIAVPEEFDIATTGRNWVAID